jgi:sterol desaturase/sphingolipid hydroxylase (fatty acid hydroxylase superfamily)
LSIGSILEDLILMFEFWIQTHWYIAFVMSLVTNLGIYFVASYLISFLTQKITKDGRLGKYIDERPLKVGQKLSEIKNGIVACAMFSLVSLLARELFVGVIPLSITQLLIEVFVFTFFYETYSYFIHRLLHTKPFRKPHSVHHYSVRTTPWSAYSVHPIEALLIAMSAPLFMLIFPVHLSVIFTFHILGVVFTLLIHSNLKLNGSNFLCQLFNRYTECHAAHHSIGNVNFGFINSFWDICFKTSCVEK